MMCKKCVLVENSDIYLNKDGVCNICVNYRRDKSKSLLEFDFIRILDKYKSKNKNKYDCILMCSGGKDSISSLYLIKKRYHLHPLVFTFDHGF
ncbi:phosphoadenosine phosphosulfate reductase, partial [bacterium]|nr:phosphoadenosine phosphosulfate reductase [bacterium]